MSCSKKYVRGSFMRLDLPLLCMVVQRKKHFDCILIPLKTGRVLTLFCVTFVGGLFWDEKLRKIFTSKCTEQYRLGFSYDPVIVYFVCTRKMDNTTFHFSSYFYSLKQYG